MAGEDEIVKVGMRFEDDYSDGAKKAADAAKDLDQSQKDVEESTLESNIAFLAQMEALDGLTSGYNQVIGGADDLGLVNQEQMEQLRKITGALDLTVGSMKLYTIATSALADVNTAFLIPSLIGVAAAAGAIGFALMAASAQSEEARATFSVLTGVATGLAAAQFTLAAANAFQSVALAGPAAPIVAGLITGGLAAIGTYLATAKEEAITRPEDLNIPGAQTEPGEYRVVEQTGRAVIHEDEVIYTPARVTRPQRMGGLGAGTVLIFQGVYDLSSRGGIEKIVDRMSPVFDAKEDRRGRTIK